MIARPQAPTRSANAGELSPAVAGRVDIKQYYSGARACKNFEPVPQGGFRQMGGTWRKGEWRRPLSARAITSPLFDVGPHTGTVTIWTGTVAGTVACVLVTAIQVTTGVASIAVQALVDGVWRLLGQPVQAIGGRTETRVAAWPPGFQPPATALRIVATFSVPSTISVGSVTAYFESGTALAPRFVSLSADNGTAYSLFVTAGIADIYTVENGHVGACWISPVTAGMLPDLDFYAEGDTVGIFHGGLESLRLFHATPSLDADWRVDYWPYRTLPKADLGGAYTTTTDVWEVSFRWTDTPTEMHTQITINGEATPAVPHTDGTNPIKSDAFDGPTWALYCAALASAINALPGIGAGVTVGDVSASATTRLRVLRFTFGGAHVGEEFDFSAKIVNTAELSALPYHATIGGKSMENLFSSSRGWPGTLELVQDRMAYGRIPAAAGAVAFSRAGEYFDLDPLGQDNAAPRLDRLRSQTSEIVLALRESKYLLIYTNRGAYFANNRTIERNSPLNFVKSSETGIQPNCRPFDLEGTDYYTAINPAGFEGRAQGGKQLLSIVYDDVSTSYNATPVSLLASHLYDKIIRNARQKAFTDTDASKVWAMRTDGRLIAGQFIESQEIVGFCEWIAASGGAVREIGMDGRNRLWLAVERAGVRTIELYDTAIYLHDAVTATPDLAGAVTGLPFENGAVVWARADGFVLGPFTVSAGAIALGDAYTSAIVGRWQPPLYESMPQVYVGRDDEVIWRPGRIHTASVAVIGTTSIAIGANNEPARDVTLNRIGDPTDAPMPARTERVEALALFGSKEGTTLTITQTRPGELTVRDYSIGAKL